MYVMTEALPAVGDTATRHRHAWQSRSFQNTSGRLGDDDSFYLIGHNKQCQYNIQSHVTLNLCSSASNNAWVQSFVKQLAAAEYHTIHPHHHERRRIKCGRPQHMAGLEDAKHCFNDCHEVYPCFDSGKHGVVTMLKNNTKHLYNVDIVDSRTHYNKENALFSVSYTVLQQTRYIYSKVLF
jgi:hypothetical protein